MRAVVTVRESSRSSLPAIAREDRALVGILSSDLKARATPYFHRSVGVWAPLIGFFSCRVGSETSETSPTALALPALGHRGSVRPSLA